MHMLNKFTGYKNMQSKRLEIKSKYHDVTY